MRPCRVHILGASGSGTTTLARMLAAAWSVPHADADDYFWVPTSPPYREKRPIEDRLALMQAVFVPRDTWVLSGSMTGWGDPVIAQCHVVVFLTLDPVARLQRLREREETRTAGQERDEDAWQEFRRWAEGYDDPGFSGRSRVTHERWLETLTQPVLRLDSARSPQVLLDAILRWEPGSVPAGTSS